MEWRDQGIVLSVRKHGETAAIVSVLTALHGRSSGLVRGGVGKRLRGTLQPGNKIDVTWRGRLAEHLGTFTVEPVRSYSAAALTNAKRLSALSSACALIDAALPEREQHPAILQGLEVLLEALEDDEVWPVIYVKWELGFLSELGFGLDLSACAATGVTENLTYVSPRSGRAVSDEAAQPYKERLLPLPMFLKGDTIPPDIGAALRLTGYFLENHVFQSKDAQLPDARARLSAHFSIEHR